MNDWLNVASSRLRVTAIIRCISHRAADGGMRKIPSHSKKTVGLSFVQFCTDIVNQNSLPIGKLLHDIQKTNFDTALLLKGRILSKSSHEFAKQMWGNKEMNFHLLRLLFLFFFLFSTDVAGSLRCPAVLPISNGFRPHVKYRKHKNAFDCADMTFHRLVYG